MSSPVIRAVVDRIEGDIAVVLIGIDEMRVDLPMAVLPPGTCEGSVLRATFALDSQETERAMDAVRARIERLRSLSRK